MRQSNLAPALFALAITLAACTQPTTSQKSPEQASNQQHSSAAGTTTAAPAEGPSDKGVGAVASTPTPAAPGEAINAQFMLGRWGDNGDCNQDIVINANGSFRSYTGGEGQWTLSGDTLRLEGKNGSFDMRLEFIDHNTLRVTNPDGSVGTSQRCG